MDKNFASDNYSGFSTEILQEINRANEHYDYGYGADKYTKLVEEEFRRLFNSEVDTFLVFNGTGANVFALDLLKRPSSAIVCSDVAHIYTMEAGTPTKITGMQILTVKSENGKIILDELKKTLKNLEDFHTPQPKIISLTQVTESGSVYTLDELKAISKLAKENDIYLHIDGARFSNALVSMDITPEKFVKEVKPDVLVFGGTKNGLIFGEAVLVFNPEIAKNGIYLRKQDNQLMSKMRFLSAQFLPYIKNNLWYKNAKSANEMAKYFEKKLNEIDIEIVGPVDANIISAKLPHDIIKPLEKFSHFYIWDEENNICRFITNFDSEAEDIDNFVNKIKELKQSYKTY